MQKNNWFEIDKKGLQQVQSEKYYDGLCEIGAKLIMREAK